MAQPAESNPLDLVVISEPAHLAEASAGQSKVWLVPSKMVSEDLQKNGVTLLAADNPKLCMALIAKEYFRPSAHHVPVGESRIHSSAAVDPTAHVGKDVIIGPYAVIGKHCRLDDGAIIGAHSVLENGVSVGAKTHIHPHVFIGHDCVIGGECEIKPHAVLGGEGFGYATDLKTMRHERITHFGKLVLGDRVHVGSGTTIDRGTFADSRIGDDAKIDNLCHFGHNIEIGQGTIVTGGVVVAGSAKIGSFCVIGGGTCIAGHLEIADQVQIGGMSGVTKSIPEKGAYGGYPLQPLRDYLKTQSSLPSLPQLRKDVAHLLKKEQ